MSVFVVENEEQYRDALKVRREVFIEEQKVPPELEIDEHEDASVHFIAYDNNQAVGAGRLRLKADQAKVERICVLKSERGKNIGLEIMKKVEAEAINRGLDVLILNAQTHALPFYEKLGYQTTSDLFYEAGIPHVEMRKMISKAS